MLIDRRAVRDFLDRDLDDHRWMKKLSEPAILAQLEKLRVPPAFKTKPWRHQLICFYLCLCNPRFLLLLDMGLGKSKLIADLITQAKRERRFDGALVLVPRLINVDSWVDDLALHSDLRPWRVDVSDIEEKRERLLNPRGDVTIIDYHGFTLAMSDKQRVVRKKKAGNELVRNDKRVKQLLKQYNFLTLDEIHKVANWNSLWYHIIDPIAADVDFCYGLTGTLFGKDPQSIHPVYQLIDRGETFGENLGLFRAAFFNTKLNPWKGVQYVYDERMDARLHEMLQNKSIRFNEEEVPELELPARVMRRRKVPMPAEQRTHYLHAVQGVLEANGKLADLDAAWFRMRQIVSGYRAWKDEYGEHLVYFKENPKLDDLEAVIESAGDSKVVVSYEYTLTGQLIVERLKKLKIGHEWLYGGTKNPSACRKRFLEDPRCTVFVMNSEAGGTGNDGLQKVARILYFFETPSSPTARQQVLKRVHRPGQTRRSFIYDSVMKGSVDIGILEGIDEGVDLYSRVVNGGAKVKGLLLG